MSIYIFLQFHAATAYKAHSKAQGFVTKSSQCCICLASCQALGLLRHAFSMVLSRPVQRRREREGGESVKSMQCKEEVRRERRHETYIRAGRKA